MMVDKELHFVVSEDDQKWIDACNAETLRQLDMLEASIDNKAPLQEGRETSSWLGRRLLAFSIFFKKLF